MTKTTAERFRMSEQYVSDAEYPSYFAGLNGIRPKVARDLPIGTCREVLDLCCGYGYFTVEVARLRPDIRVTGIDLREYDVERTIETARRTRLSRRIRALVMDATHLDFPNHQFDLAVNFGGLEDIHMTRGRRGVLLAFKEVGRVLKPGAFFCFAAIPPDEMDTRAQFLETRVFSYACGAAWLSSGEYEKMLAQSGFTRLGKKRYYTKRKLTPTQAQEEIRFACEVAPKYYGVKARTSAQVWKKFGPDIEQHGLGQFSKVVVFKARKNRGAGSAGPYPVGSGPD